jgi:hypothetical protein
MLGTKSLSSDEKEITDKFTGHSFLDSHTTSFHFTFSFTIKSSNKLPFVNFTSNQKTKNTYIVRLVRVKPHFP